MGLLVHHSDAPSAGRDETRGYGRFSLPDPIFLLKPQRNSSCGRAGSRRLDPSPLRQASDLVLCSCLILVPRSVPPADHYMGRFRNARRPQLEFGCASRQVFGSGREIPEYELRGGGKQRDGRTAAWPGGRTQRGPRGRDMQQGAQPCPLREQRCRLHGHGGCGETAWSACRRRGNGDASS